jgi:uncharacterized protein (DUF2267 family)
VTFTPKRFQSPPPPIASADVPLSTLRERMTALVAKQKKAAEAALLRQALEAKPHQPATAGELAEQRHLLYDADPDATVPAFPYPTTQEAS